MAAVKADAEIRAISIVVQNELQAAPRHDTDSFPAPMGKGFNVVIEGGRSRRPGA